MCPAGKEPKTDGECLFFFFFPLKTLFLLGCKLMYRILLQQSTNAVTLDPSSYRMGLGGGGGGSGGGGGGGGGGAGFSDCCTRF